MNAMNRKMTVENKKIVSFEEQQWIADSGASHHMTNSSIGFFNVKPTQEKITVGNGESIEAEYMGDIQGHVVSGKEKLLVTMKNVGYVPALFTSLFSLTVCLANGMNIGNVGKTICVEKNKTKKSFPHYMESVNGYVGYMNFIPLKKQTSSPMAVARFINLYDPTG